MKEHQVRAAFELLLPWAGCGQVGFHDAQLGMQLTQDGDILGVLVDGNDLVAGIKLETRDQVLADQTCSACYNNFF
jgi:protein-disulfide isomerase